MATFLNLGNLFTRLKPRQLTPGELLEREAERKAREHLKGLETSLAAEADLYAERVIGKLIDLNICYRHKKSETSFGDTITPVALRRPYVLTEEAIYLEVDLRAGRSPRGIGVEDLEDERILKNLAMACEHPVYFKYSPGKGAWYIIERETGKRGIPVHVKYDDILTARPASADGLSLPIGMGENKKPIYRSMGQMYSMLVAGTIGGGKSNFLNVLLCTLLRYNSPKQLQLMLVDLKGGMEFTFFQDVPHLLSLPAKYLKPPKKVKKGKDIVVKEGKLELGEEVQSEEDNDPDDGIMLRGLIEKREHVPGALRWIVQEGERRMALMKGQAKSIGQYNFSHRKKPLAHIIVVIDEWADVKLEATLGKQAEDLLINIASRFRAVGIHVILCTQTPNKEVVSIRVKNVMPARLIFNCPDQFASILLLGDASAHGLNPVGRSFFVWGSTRAEIQTPYINNATVDGVVAQAVAGKFNEISTSSHDVTDEEILDWCLTSNNGELSWRTVYQQFRLRGLTADQAKAFCKSYEGQEVVIGSATYKVLLGVGNHGRRLIPIEEPTEVEEEPKAEAPAPEVDPEEEEPETPEDTEGDDEEEE